LSAFLGFLSRIHHQDSLDSDSDPAPQRAIMNEHSKLLRFLGDTPSAIFINTLSVVSSIFTIWGFIETRDDMIEMKKMKEEEEANASDQTEQLEELNQKLEGIRSGITDEIENLTHSFKQLICRFDAVHAKRHSVSQECLKFIRSLNKPTLSNADPSEAKHPHYKSNYIEKTNSLSTHWNQQVNNG
jgi:hypothetical protein